MSKARTWDTERHGGFIKKQLTVYADDSVENEGWQSDDFNEGWNAEETSPHVLNEYYESVKDYLFVDTNGRIIVDAKKFRGHFKSIAKTWLADQQNGTSNNTSRAKTEDTITRPPNTPATNLEEVIEEKDGGIKVPVLQGQFLAKAKNGGAPVEKVYVMLQVPSGTQADQIQSCSLSSCGTKLKVTMLWNTLFAKRGLRGLFDKNDPTGREMREIYSKGHPAVIAYESTLYELGLNSFHPKPLMIEVPLISQCERITPLNNMGLNGADPVVRR